MVRFCSQCHVVMLPEVCYSCKNGTSTKSQVSKLPHVPLASEVAQICAVHGYSFACANSPKGEKVVVAVHDTCASWDVLVGDIKTRLGLEMPDIVHAQASSRFAVKFYRTKTQESISLVIVTN